MRTNMLCLLLTLAAFAIAVPAIPALCKQRTTPVEVWCGGDDGLTQRLKDALEQKLNLSPKFRLSSGKKPGTLVVTIPSNVKWKDVGRRTRVLYEVDFSTYDGKTLGRINGSCWDDRLVTCAADITRDAADMARKIADVEPRSKRKSSAR